MLARFEKLGEILLAEGVITIDELHQALSRQKDTGRRLGEEKGSSAEMKAQGEEESSGSMMEGEDTGQKAETGAVMVNNPICPVSGQKVGGAMGPVVHYEYKGKIYNFCCTMCLKDFQKDPEKYVKIVDEMMAGEKTQEEGEAHEEHEHQ